MHPSLLKLEKTATKPWHPPSFPQEQIDAIHNAAARGDLSDVKELVRVKGPHSRTSKLAQTLDGSGRLPLHLAAWYGNTAVVQLLTERYPAGLHVLDKVGRVRRPAGGSGFGR